VQSQSKTNLLVGFPSVSNQDGMPGGRSTRGKAWWFDSTYLTQELSKGMQCQHINSPAVIVVIQLFNPSPLTLKRHQSIAVIAARLCAKSSRHLRFISKAKDGQARVEVCAHLSQGFSGSLS
jgi:hypothetical protein